MAVSLPSLKAKTEQKDEIAFRWKHRPIGDFPKIRKLGPLILLGSFGDGPTQSSAWRYDGWRKMYIIKKVLYELKSEKCGRLFSPLHLNEYFVELRYMQQQQVMRLKFMLSISQNELSVIMTFRILLQVLNWTLSRPFWHRNMLWLKPFPCSFLSSAPFTSPPASTMQFLVAYPQPDAVTTINHHGEGFGCIWPEYLPATVCGQLYGFLSKITFVFLGWKFTFMKEKCPKWSLKITQSMMLPPPSWKWCVQFDVRFPSNNNIWCIGKWLKLDFICARQGKRGSIQNLSSNIKSQPRLMLATWLNVRTFAKPPHHVPATRWQMFFLFPGGSRQRVWRRGSRLRGVGQRRVVDHRKRHQLRVHSELHVHERGRGEAVRLPRPRV